MSLSHWEQVRWPKEQRQQKALQDSWVNAEEGTGTARHSHSAWQPRSRALKALKS